MTDDEALDELGFEPNDYCPPEVVKERYRKLAQEHHPDKGGDTTRFQRIKAAYEQLTGKAPPDNSKNEILARVNGLLLAAINGQDENADFVALVVRGCKGVQRELHARVAETRAAVRKRERVLKRMRGRTPEHNALQEMVKGDIDRHEKSIKELEAEVVKAQEVIDFLQDYKCEEIYDTTGTSTFTDNQAFAFRGFLKGF